MKREKFLMVFFFIFIISSQELLIALKKENVSIGRFDNGIHLNIREEDNCIYYEWILKPGESIEMIHLNPKRIQSQNNGFWNYQMSLAFQKMGGEKKYVSIKRIDKGGEILKFWVEEYNKNFPLYIHCILERCYDTRHMGGAKKSNPLNGTTFYIRVDGGTSGQCTGTVDAPYPGSGVNQPCAWSHPFWALNGNGKWKINGGDTIIISPGDYKMGYGAPNTSWCEQDGAFDCVLPPLPSGPDINHPTRILGKGWDSGCLNPPELWGTQRPWQIIDLTGSSNVYIGCLEITDHSDCVEFHENSSVSCERDSYPFGDWASDGLLASDSANVTLKHLNIHGLASAGIRAGRLSNWTVEDVRVAGNGWVGWEGDLPDQEDSNSGTILFKRFMVEWNGCGETYPGKQPHNCWSQTAGGYGDGLGTGATGGHWIFQDSIFRYNTSDGLDLLYARIPGSKIDIQRTMSYGNAGNPIKVNGPATIENCLLIGDCGFFNGKSFTYNVDDCRAGGNSLEFALRQGITVSVVNSTIVGQGDCLMAIQCDEDATCNGTEKVMVQNNIFQGSAEFSTPSDTTCYIWFDRYNYYDTFIDYNVVYDVKMGEMSLAGHEDNRNPLLINTNFESFNGHLQINSPAIDTGLAVGSLNGLIPDDDLEGNGRPSGGGVDRGAYEYQSSSPSPTINVLSPNGGENWVGGTTQTIRWNSTGNIGNIKLQYSINNGSNWLNITTSTLNDGSYLWILPNVNSSSCLVKVSETDGNPSDTSDSVFSISFGSGQNPVISLNREQLFFGSLGNQKTTSQYFLISNEGSGTLNWSVSSEQNWIGIAPHSGTDDGQVLVSVESTGLYPGDYSGDITISDPSASNSPQLVGVTLHVYSESAGSSPFGSFDSPVNEATVRSSIPVTGWALDDIQVTNIAVYRGGNNTMVKLGDAVMVEGARPDVEQSYPNYPMSYKAGWGYMLLTNFLPNGGNGTFTLHAIATDKEGNHTSLGEKTIFADNINAVKPFGAIDTPTQGGEAVGNDFINWGWVLTPQPNRIPINGSTVNVYVDGVNLGNPIYNIFRSDIATLFPGYANSNGAVGYYILDTTSFDAGIHTLNWVATDDDGNTDGIGSRYFSIQNTTKQGSSIQNFFDSSHLNKTLGDFNQIPNDSTGFVHVKTGYNEKFDKQVLNANTFGVFHLEIKEVEPVVIYLNEIEKKEKFHFEGFLINNHEIRSLPIGSYLDKEKGVFYWQPGPGFRGKFYFVFIKTMENFQWQKKILINICLSLNPM